MVNWENPYESLSEGLWVKGNLHTHTAPQSPCGRVELDRVLELYENNGYDFLSISDHLHCTSVTTPTNLITIPGLEWNSRTELQNDLVVTYQDHIGMYSLNERILEGTTNHRTPVEALDSIRSTDSLVILNHPNWLVPHHYLEEELFSLYHRADGMEVYNSVIERHPGEADATMKWDRVLTEKGPLLGFASDDSHIEGDIGKTWIMVNVQERSAEEVFAAITVGRFYCSTGAAIHEIGLDGNAIYCVTDKDTRIDIIGENGQQFASAKQELRFNWKDTDSSYLRFALYGQAKKQAWSQPFFRNPFG